MAHQQQSSQLQLFFRGEGLKDMDTFSKSDTYVVVYAGATAKGTPIGRTETLKDNLNPQFERSVPAQFIFETRQDFTVKIFDDDGNGPAGDDVIATAHFQLSHVVGSRDSTLKLPLQPKGALYVSAKEESQAGRDTVVLRFRGTKMKNMDTFGKSDPFFKLERMLPNGTTKLLHQSKAIDNTLEPDWPALPKLGVAAMTTGNMNEKTLRFSCFDEDVMGADSMGSFTVSFMELLNAHRNRQPFTLKDQKGGAYGDILVTQCDVVHYPTFLEYLRGGLQINLAVSVDFTGSNGQPSDPRSLHYMDPVNPNQYVRAIMSVGDVLLEYDSDKMIPAFGFGAYDPSGQITHFFHLNMQQSPYVAGVQGLLDSYAHALTQFRLSGPTNFAPTISNVRNMLAQASPNTYTILLILTDGDITDMQQTIAAIVDSDETPMSIIIVGVGNACDFEMMNQLDGDGQRLVANGKRMKRDIVQFVPFRNFASAPPHSLAAEVLREVPNQVVDWAISVGRKA